MHAASDARVTAARRAFVVDGDRHTGALITAFLDELGFVTTIHSDGEAALAAARIEPPELVVAEVVAARFGGLDLCRALKADPRTASARVAIVSVIAAAARARASGADAFLAKPLEKARFLGVVRALLTREPSETTA